MGDVGDYWREHREHRSRVKQRERGLPEHHCHVPGCDTRTKPELLMCGPHWKLVPKDLQRAVWRHYRPGQCVDMKTSAEWREAARAAIDSATLRVSWKDKPTLDVEEGLQYD